MVIRKISQNKIMIRRIALYTMIVKKTEEHKMVVWEMVKSKTTMRIIMIVF